MIDCKKSFVFETSLFEWVGRSIGISSSTQLNSDLDNCLKVAQGESGGVILQPDATSAVYVGFTTSVLEGYQILGCIGYALNQTDLLIANIMTSGNQMRFDVKNIGSTTKTIVVVAKILLMKSS